MSNPAVLVAFGLLLLILLFSATINITLRRMSRVRLSETLRESGREHLMDNLVQLHHDLALCMAMIRTTCAVALALVALRICEQSHIPSDTLRYLIAFAASLGFAWVFGVAIPTAWSKYAGESFLARTIPVLFWTGRVLHPLVWMLRVFDALVRRLAGVGPESADDDAARHERELLDAVSEGEKLGAVDEEEKEMIESIMDLRDADVARIMTPRTEMEAVEKGTSLPEIKDRIRQIGHSRIPVYDENIDNVVGVIYAKDLLHIDDSEPFKAIDVMRKPLFIPETKNVRDLLHDFQTQKVHMAIVLDEYGGTAGLVTIEDILEELVGEIADEYDPDEPAAMTRIDADTVDIDARMRLDELNEELDIELPDREDYETIGGFVFSTMGRIPTVGERCAHDNIEIQVIDAEPRRINRLRLHVNRNGRKGRQQANGVASPP